MLGLPKGQVFLVDWDKEWTVLFKNEKQRILELVKDDNIKVHHIGSTSVPNLKSKPILDIAVEVSDLREINKYTNLLNQLGYVSLGNAILPDRYYFIKGNPRTHQIHLYEKNNKFLKDQIFFRDILRTNSVIKNEYEVLKLKLAEANQNNKHKYADMKTEFITSVLESFEELK